jgi:methylene-tetrahydromethanopterin dehydrogenase
MPIKVKKKEKEEKLLYFFDTDDYCSPFDINMGYDAGFNAVLPYCKMTAENVPKLVQDAMFSRKAGAPTVFFVGGSNVEEGEKIAEKVLNSLVPPFESPVIIDPRGAHTTASAIVAKTIEVARKHGISDLSGKKIVCLGGTGPVGQIAALIASKLNAKVVITSRREDYVKELTDSLNKKLGKGARKITGAVATSEEQYFDIVSDADILWAVGKAGIQILSKELMKTLPPNKIVVDINLVPPYGVEGMNPNFNNEEFYPGIYGIGALDIGRLKYKVESGIFKEAAMTKGKKIFDYNIAFEMATKILFGEEITISE